MVNELTVGIGGSTDCFRKRLHWNRTREDRRNPVNPGGILIELTACVTDHEDFLLYDDNRMIFMASRKLWECMFNHMRLKTILVGFVFGKPSTASGLGFRN
ncbi:hypothetical protein Y032_0033g2664 [Ancylostoma ceylanicum]|uniref:Uncharacterized protein n=1 Tax=Ancylostoma ceylanicum TaxID=53326 RepID=A0A016UNE9_9BILA|nr:hypothetical protein Y032_0033g2664 [Ancylostoma ceylanicum]